MTISDVNKAKITIPVDLTNPGQFFACCGLLELASRLDEEAEGWFEHEKFHIRTKSSFGGLIDCLRQADVANTMTQAQISRHEELSRMSKKEREQSRLEDEKRALDALRREVPIVIEMAFTLRMDWFRDNDSGGSRFKTWAGQQSVLASVEPCSEPEIVPLTAASNKRKCGARQKVTVARSAREWGRGRSEHTVDELPQSVRERHSKCVVGSSRYKSVIHSANRRGHLPNAPAGCETDPCPLRTVPPSIPEDEG